MDKQITSVKTSSGSQHLNVSLSEGPDYLNYKQNVYVSVRDKLGATQEFLCGEVVVSISVYLSIYISHKTTRVVKTCHPCMFDELEDRKSYENHFIDLGKMAL